MLVKDPITGQVRIEKTTAPVKYLETGKVKIGSALIPRLPAMSADAEQIQGALLGVRTRVYSTLSYLTYYAVLAVIICAFLLVSCK
jgi:hypothetical protein